MSKIATTIDDGDKIRIIVGASEIASVDKSVFPNNGEGALELAEDMINIHSISFHSGMAVGILEFIEWIGNSGGDISLIKKLAEDFIVEHVTKDFIVEHVTGGLSIGEDL